MARELADATAAAIREAAEHGDHVTTEALRAELSGPIVRLTGDRVFDDVNTGSVLGQVAAKAAAPEQTEAPRPGAQEE